MQLEFEPSTAVNVTVMPSSSPASGIPDRARDREADRGRRREPLGASGRHRDPDGLQARPALQRAGGAALGRHRPPDRQAACAARQGRQASVHPIGGRELRALRRLKREAPAGTYVFVSERGAPLSVAGYQRMVARAGEAAGFPFLVHSPHAAAFLRLQARQRRPGHAGYPALPWAQVDQVDGPLHGAGA